MATTVGQHSVSTFATPVNGGPLDANVVRGNDNTIRSAYVAHDSDTGIHVQSSTLAQRPTAGTAGRKWITTDAGDFHLWYDDGTTWHEVGTATLDIYVLADETLAKGDVVKVTGYNVGNNAPRVAKVSSASDIAFGMVTAAITSGAVGYITNTGIISGLATNSFAIGDILYPNTSGGLTTTKPTSGNYQPVAYVLRSGVNTGVIYVEFSAPRIVEASANTASTIVLRDASGNFSAGTITAGALTSSGLVTFASLKGTGSTTVTDILNDNTMATASATTLATSSSIKAYVDAQVGTVDTLAEVLANGNTTGAHNIIVSSGQKITTNTIDETTAAAGVTIDSVLLKDDVVNATDIEVDTISANNGTLAVTLASSGVATIAQQPILSSLTASQAVFTDSSKGLVSNAITGSGNVVMSASPTLTGTITAAALSMSGTLTLGTDVALSRGAADRLDLATGDSFNVVSGSYKIANTDVLTSTTLGSGIVNSSLTSVGTLASLTVSGALVANGNVTLGDATSDTITVGGSFPTGTKLRTDSSVGNTLAVSAYDVDGTAYVDLITATASNTPTLALTSTGVGSMNNIAIGGSTPAAGAFTTLGSSGDFAVATNKFTVASATGNTAVAGTLTTEGTLTSNGNTVLGNAATDTITATAQFVTGTQLKSAQSANNTLALSAYDVDGTAYVDLVKLTAGNTPTLTLTSTGVGSLDNITIGGSTAAAGSFTSLSASGNFTLGADVVLSRGAANRLDLASGDSLNLVAGDISVTGNISASGTLTLGSDVVLSRGAADRLDLASGDSLNVVSGDYRIGNTSVLNSTTLGSGVTASSLTSVGTLSSLTVSGDLTVDTSTLKVDSANNRVGIGTASPSYTLDVRGNVASVFSGPGYQAFISDGGGANNSYLSLYQAASAWILTANKNGSGSRKSISISTTGGDTTVADLILDTSGNLGLGVTPSAWATLTPAFQIGTGGAFISSQGSFSALYSGANAYYNGTNWKYVTTAEASYALQSSGEHKWFTAPSGTAGNNITFTERARIDASGNLLVGTTTTTNNLRGNQKLAVVSTGNVYPGISMTGYLGANAAPEAILDFQKSRGATDGTMTKVESGDSLGIIVFRGADGTAFRDAASISAVSDGATGASDMPGRLVFSTTADGSATLTERARITSDGAFLVGSTSYSSNVKGNGLDQNGFAWHTREGDVCLTVNRKTSDGTLIIIAQDDTTEGTISVSGNTVSYNAFAGSHWSQLEDGSKPEILRGTVMEALDELCEWPGEQNERLPKAKVSDTVGSKKVYGVFMAWDNDWTETNDMLVTSLGAFVCRVAADVVVEQGDLLESNGDGTARVQADDVIRSSTIGKVTSTVKTHEYEDGTYCVPTVLYCG